MALALLLGGGSVFGACEMRFRDAFVTGLQGLVINDIFSPENILPLLDASMTTDGATVDETAGNTP